MKKKILISSIILFFLPIMLTLLQGCRPCWNVKSGYFEVTNMYVLPSLRNQQNSPYQNQSISPSEISFWLGTDVKYYSANYQNEGYSLMACDPGPPRSKETITNIEIYSNRDFEGYPAESNLAPLLEINDWYNIEQSLVEYLATKYTVQERYYLYFSSKAKPVSGSHQFKIIFTDSKNRVFEMNTEVNFK